MTRKISRNGSQIAKMREKDFDDLIGDGPEDTSKTRKVTPGAHIKTPQWEAVRIRREEAYATKLELQNAIARKEMLPAGEVEREWSNALRDLRAALLALPSRMQQRLPHLTPHDVAALDREIRDALTELADDD